MHTALSGTSSLCGPSHQLSVNKLLYYSVSTNGGAEAQIHNGNLTNPEALRDELTVGDAFSRYLRTSSDSEVLLNVFADALHKVRFSSQLKPLRLLGTRLFSRWSVLCLHTQRWCGFGCSDGTMGTSWVVRIPTEFAQTATSAPGWHGRWRLRSRIPDTGALSAAVWDKVERGSSVLIQPRVSAVSLVGWAVRRCTRSPRGRTAWWTASSTRASAP